MIFKIPIYDVAILKNPFGNDITNMIAYVNVNDMDDELLHWFKVNPRAQNMRSPIAKQIMDTLSERPQIFHSLNKGIIITAKSASIQENVVEFELSDENIHGVADGGHTLKSIWEVKRNGRLPEECYVKLDLRAGMTELEIISMVVAQNQIVQVDAKSLANLQDSFEVLKEILKDEPFADRIVYKMNEEVDSEGKAIDVADVLSLIATFSKDFYPQIGTDKDLRKLPIHLGKQGKILKQFVSMDKEARENMLYKMQPIISDIFKLWDLIEFSLPYLSKKIERKYINFKGVKHSEDKKYLTYFTQVPTNFSMPRVITYPIFTAFRKLVDIDDQGYYFWKLDPIDLMQKDAGDYFSKYVIDSHLTILKNSSMRLHYHTYLSYLAVCLLLSKKGQM